MTVLHVLHLPSTLATEKHDGNVEKSFEIFAHLQVKRPLWTCGIGNCRAYSPVSTPIIVPVDSTPIALSLESLSIESEVTEVAKNYKICAKCARR